MSARKFPSIIDRLRLKTTITRDGCWLFPEDELGGYGRIRHNGVKRRVHHVSYELHHGPIPEGKWILHTCVGHRNCWNPNHLYAGTPKENTADMDAQGRRNQVRGESQGLAKLTPEIVREIRGPTGGFGHRQIAEMYGISPATVWQVRSRTTWNHV